MGGFQSVRFRFNAVFYHFRSLSIESTQACVQNVVTTASAKILLFWQRFSSRRLAQPSFWSQPHGWLLMLAFNLMLDIQSELKMRGRRCTVNAAPWRAVGMRLAAASTPTTAIAL